MQIGVVFPHNDIGPDVSGVREYALAVEGLGYDHILSYEHVLGASARNRPDWGRRYQQTDIFHEPFVMFGYIAAITQRIEMITGILVLPQRQTALVAKQAAEVDRLSGGRLQLGVGLGWNPVEYEALGENFKNRGKRLEEQIDVLKQLWANDVVDYSGTWHRISEAGINPMPIKGSIPIWIGASDDRAVVRAARIADGWYPMEAGADEDRIRTRIEFFRNAVRGAGRDPEHVGISGRISYSDGEDAILKQARYWRDLGASHVSVNMMNAGLASAGAHIDAMAGLKPKLDAALAS